MKKKIRSIGTSQKRIRSIGTTRSSVGHEFVVKTLGAEPCGIKIDTNTNPMSRYVLRKCVHNKILKTK